MVLPLGLLALLLLLGLHRRAMSLILIIHHIIIHPLSSRWYVVLDGLENIDYCGDALNRITSCSCSSSRGSRCTGSEYRPLVLGRLGGYILCLFDLLIPTDSITRRRWKGFNIGYIIRDQTKIVIASCVMAVVMNNATAQSILQWEVTFIIVRYEEIVDMRITSSAWIHRSVVQPTTLHLLLHVRYDCSIHSIQ